MTKRPVARPRPRKMHNTTEDLTTLVQRRPKSVQRMRVVLDIDMPEDTFSREDFNEAVISWAGDLATKYVQDDRAQVVYLTTQEFIPE